MSPETTDPARDIGEFSPAPAKIAFEAVASYSQQAPGGEAASSDGPADPPLKTHPDAFSAPGANPGPATALLSREMTRMELMWLADKSTAPHDDLCADLLRQLPLTDAVVCDVLRGRNAAFLAALLLRGCSRLWTAGPNAHPQPL